MPVVAPTFVGEGWEAEVEELLGRIAPTAEGDAVVTQLVQAVKRLIHPVLPEADVAGYASANFMSGTAFCVAVPEVELVISASPAVLVSCLQGRWVQGRGSVSRLDTQKLQKSTIRACTDRLIGSGVFKFRRSAFRGLEPKVTVVAPAGRFGCNHGVALNLSVNTVTPMYNAALLAECSRRKARAKDLVLLVKHWAKDRGLCHTAKGHLSPYTWTLLVIYFFQVGTDEGALLPPLDEFESLQGLMKRRSRSPAQSAAAGEAPPPKPASGGSARSAGEHFKDFIEFYTKQFNWRKEAVSVRLARRAMPDLRLPLHIVDCEDGTTEVGPSIEDPFEPTRNLGDCMTAQSIEHLHAELARARDLCSKGGSLTELLQPWAPEAVIEATAEAAAAEASAEAAKK